MTKEFIDKTYDDLYDIQQWVIGLAEDEEDENKKAFYEDTIESIQSMLYTLEDLIEEV